jgi:segregation and condensation protein B
MSLKAKIEAVIYASEEPVTLAQLVGVLGDEVQAELDRLAEAQRTPSLVDVAAPGFEEAVETGSALEPAGEAAEASANEPAKPPAGEAAVAEAGAEEKQAAREERARMQRVREHLRGLLGRLVEDYAAADSDRGLEIREVAGGFRFATKPEYHDAVRGFVKSLKPPLKLSLQALETLAVVAYKQPVTAPEISEIRGVDSSGVLGSLIARKLIATAGRKHVIGRPILYRTTREFLLKFGLKDVAELPSIEEFEKMAGQMAEQEEIPMGEPIEERERRESDGEERGPEPVADEVIVDGRESGLPPRYDEVEDDPSAAESEILGSASEG